MQRLFLLTFLGIGGSSLAMHIEPGQPTTWHTRKYLVIEKIEKPDGGITIVMSRPMQHVCCVPLTIEYVKRELRTENNKHTELSATSTHALSHQGKQALAATGGVALLLISYLLQ